MKAVPSAVTIPHRESAQHARLRHLILAGALWASAFTVYQTTFICTPRLFLFPKVGPSFFDTQDHTAALRGRPNDIDMRKHLLYTPTGPLIYAAANRARSLIGIRRECIALIFPNALCGSLSVVIAYFIFLRLMRHARRAAAAAALYAFTYAVWLMAGLTESYALTALSINLFLLFALRENAHPSWRWCCGAVALIGLSSLCDVRSLLLLALPVYLIARAPELRLDDKRERISFCVIGAFVVVALAYESYKYISGRACFGAGAMCAWLLRYGHEFTSDKWAPGHVRAPLSTVFAFLVQSLSPLSAEQLAQAPPATERTHLFLAYSFISLSTLIAVASLRSIIRELASRVSLQGVGCWLIAYLAYHIVYSPWSAILFAPPMVLPLLLITLPGMIAAWTRRRHGAWVLALAVAAMLVNNLLVINEARIAWQRPPLVRSPDDRIYLIPGEMERAQFLIRKISSLSPAEERARSNELRARAARGLTEPEKHELDELTRRGIERLAPAERAQLGDVMYRYHNACRLARGVI